MNTTGRAAAARPDPHVLCPFGSGKVAYRPKAEAKATLHGARRRGGLLKRVYRCDGCGLFHVTSRGRR